MKLSEVRLALVFKDFAAWLRTSCTGLNVAGHATANVLRLNGIDATVFPVRHNVDVVRSIDRYNEEHQADPLTHVVISAPWLSAWDMAQLLIKFPQIKFVVLSHSNVGFLQADADGVWNLRKYINLAEYYPNLRIGGNSEKFVNWLRNAYGNVSSDFMYLPNLYPISLTPMRVWADKPAKCDQTIRIGAFGAVRPYKNFMTAAGAAIVIQRYMGVPVELHMSGGGEAGDVAAIEQLCGDVPYFKLIMHPWQYWDDFIRLVAQMDLLLQPSYTESFNMITADGIYVGVPSVVSPAIDWAPTLWKANSDQPVEVAQIGIHLLRDLRMAEAGRQALINHDEVAIGIWKDFLAGVSSLYNSGY